MRTQYDTELLKEINQNADLFDYVSQTMELERRGNNYFGHCPKHVDATPSLCINPEKNGFHCFSCNRQGGFLGYLLEYEGLSMDQAVKKGVKLAGIDSGKLCKSATVAYLRRYRELQHKKIRVIYHNPIDASVLDKYRCDFPQEWLDEGITKTAMNQFGVRIDDFNNRIVYPVYDLSGQLINIKGRTRYENYKELKIAKYINYYKIGVMDYFQGLNFTLPYVKAKNELIIFESVKSTMQAFGWGYCNTASAEKHTLTDEQLSLLIRLRVNVVFAYDSDVNYWSKDVRRTIDKLKRITNVYIIYDNKRLLGGIEAKNAPVDCGKEVWEELYRNKRKVI